MRKLSGRKCRFLFLAMGLLAASLAAVALAQQDSVEMRIRRDLAFLASKECEGRGVETQGLEKAADYIAEQFKAAGLQPGGKNGSWFQPFKISQPGKLKNGSRVILHGPQGQSIELRGGTDFTVMGYSAGGMVKAPVVFAGYGATIADKKYDDFENIDAEGKIVIVLRRLPRWSNKQAPFVDENQKQQHAALNQKMANTELHKAAAMILVNDRSVEGDELTKYGDLARGVGGSIPAVHMKRSVLDGLLRTTQLQGLVATEDAIDRELKPHSAALTGWTATIDTKVERKEITVKNVIGVLKGTGMLAKEIILVGAHYDHLGYGERGSLAKGKDRKKIHFGADDNGSGTTAILEMARRFGAMKNRKGRTLVFMTFSGEEKGLLGSRHYCNKEPLFPLSKIAAMVNLDMVGRMQDNKLIAQGTGSAKSFDALLETLNEKYKFKLRKVPAGTGPSDHDSFFRKEIPVFFLWTGTHKDYHRPTDTFDRINYKDMQRVIGLAGEVVENLATEKERPVYVAVKGSGGSGRPVGNMPKMGIRPAYDSEKKGLLIDGVSAGGAAEKAGMKGGDLIVSIADQPVTNIRTYMLIMSRQKAGRPLPVIVERDNKKITLKVTPTK